MSQVMFPDMLSSEQAHIVDWCVQIQAEAGTNRRGEGEGFREGVQ